MKKIILFIVLFTITALSQNYIIRQDSLRASEGRLKTAIRDSLDANVRGWQTATQVANKILDSLNANSRSWQSKSQVESIVGDSTAILRDYINTIGGGGTSDVDSTIVNNLIKDYIDSTSQAIIGYPATLDSLITAFWTGTLGSGGGVDTQTVNNLITTYIDTTSQSIIGSAATLDSMIASYWAGTLGGSSIDTPKVNNLIATYIDTTNKIIRYSSIDSLKNRLAYLENLIQTLAGGDSSQVLAKRSGADYDWTWATISGTIDLSDTIPPSPPTNLIAYGGEYKDTVRLTWTDPNDLDLDSIRLYRSIQNDSITAYWIGSVGAGVQTYIDTGRQAGVTYWYWAKSLDDSANLSYTYSNVDSATTLQEQQEQPFYVIDFETGDLSQFTSTVNATKLTIVSDTVSQGNYALRVDSLSSYGLYNFVDSLDTVYAVFDIYVTPTTSTNVTVFMFNRTIGLGDRSPFGILTSPPETNNRWAGGPNSGSYQTIATGTNFSRGTWHTVKVLYSIYGDSSYHKFWVDGTLIGEVTYTYTTQGVQAFFGAYAAAGISGYYYLDNLRLYRKDPNE